MGYPGHMEIKMKLLGILLVTAAVTLTGCATNSDITNLQSQIDTVRTDIIEVSTATTAAKLAAEQAATSATNAANSAILAEEASKLTNIKLNSLFNHFQYK